MINKGQTNTDELRIQGLLDRYLRFRSSATVTEGHLDEDSLSSFVEGRLSKREATPILKHLIDCSFCLNVTVELARLEMAFTEDTVMTAAVTPANEPAKVSDVLKNLLSSIFGTQDGAVFAHHESEENPENDAKEDKKES